VERCTVGSVGPPGAAQPRADPAHGETDDREPAQHLLLIEDDGAYAALVRDFLSRDRYRLTRVGTLADALIELSSDEPDCVLLDLTLPDARELVALRRVTAAAPATPVVVITGHDDDAVALASVGEGAHEYLAKAEVSPRRLRRSIGHAIERKRSEMELEWKAQHDSLTRLPNRATLVDRLQLALNRLERRPTHEIAVLFIDLDGFKGINDEFGHDAGDALLREVAARLETAIRPMDTVARYGGDEFVVVCEDLDGHATAKGIVRRICAALAVPFRVGDRAMDLRASVGVAFGRAGGAATTLLANADAAMYEAKGEEGSSWRIAQPAPRADGHARGVADAEPRPGLPIAKRPRRLAWRAHVDARSCALRAIEPLIAQGPPPPGEYGAREPVLWDDLGSLLELTARLAGPGTKTDVQVSGDALRDAAAGPAVDGLGDAASALRLRISERTLLEADAAVVALLAEARERGVGLVLTDVGSLATPFMRLGELGFEAIALPTEFVNLLGSGLVGRQRVLEGVVAVAGSFGVGVDAVGVDTADTLERLREAGFRQLQGRALSARPQAARAGDGAGR
jgi:diguanylate cyclase (GGDEF)-like protein